MQIVILPVEELKNELLASAATAVQNIIWVDELLQFQDHKDADAFVDLAFERDHITVLNSLLPKLIVINSVTETLAETNQSFVRINAWPTLLQSTVTEASYLDDSKKQMTEELFSVFNKKIEWLSDEPGFLTPRVVSMIINEAFISLGEGVSTKQQIDTAMKLGTNYPYGPFEWAEKIGIDKVQALLQKLSNRQIRYTSYVKG